MEAYQILARKYRPQTFDEVIGQKPVVQTLRNAIDSQRWAQAYIFSGMRGVGKTTVARILAKALNCEQGPTSFPCNSCFSCVAIRQDRSIDVLEIDGASNRGVDEISPIRDAAKVKPIQSRYKVIIIDEVHMLSKWAFNALLKTLEEPPASTIFIFATTEFDKVPLTIVSRCQHFEFKRISQKDIAEHLLLIAQKEGINLSRLGARLLAEAADGSLRDAESLLDKAVAFGGPKIKDEDLKEILGLVPRAIIFDASSLIFEGQSEKVFSFIHKIISEGYDLKLFYEELLRHFRNLLLVKSLENVQELLFLTPEEIRCLQGEAEKASSVDLLRYLQTLLQAEAGLRYTAHPQIYLETLLVRLCHQSHLIPLKDIFRSLEEGKIREFLERTDFFSEAKASIPERNETLNLTTSSKTKLIQDKTSLIPREKTEVSDTIQIGAKKELPKEEAKRAKEAPGELSQEEGHLIAKTEISPAEKEAILNYPAIQAFMSFFQGKLVSIEPLARPKNVEEVS